MFVNISKSQQSRKWLNKVNLSLTAKNLQRSQLCLHTFVYHASQPIRAWVLSQLFYKMQCKSSLTFQKYKATLSYINLRQLSLKAKRKANVCDPCSLHFQLLPLLFLLFVTGKFGMNKSQQILFSTPTSILLHSS